MRFRIRSKVAAALLLPLVALVAGSGLLAAQARDEADQVDREIGVALIGLGPGSVTSALQDERNFVAIDLIGLGGATAVPVDSFEQATANTDAATTDLEAQLAGFDPSVRESFAPAMEALRGLSDVRERYRSFDGKKDFGNVAMADEVFESYRSVIDAFFGATASIAADLDHASLRNGVEIFDALNRRGEALSVAIRDLAMDMLGGERSPQAAVTIGAGAARVRLMQDRIHELAVGPYAGLTSADASGAGVDQALKRIDGYVAGKDVDLAALLDTDGLGASSADDLVRSTLLDEAGTIRGAAQDRMRLFVIAAAAIVSLAILVTYFATTSITRPLRALREQADDLARTRLPGAVRSILDTPPGEDVAVPELEPVQVATRDEVGDVVEALNEVQSSTLTLAADQAVLRRNVADSFVNLGRRNQLLLDRQLDFITQLEQNETDPEQLDALFRLDHLATRMRRNAESLLVLAGAESPRQWSAPVPMSDVIRAGLAEVEDYQRVTIRHLDDADVLGQAVAGLAHVVAELAENALTFSPPDEQVEIKGRWTASGDYVVAIADNGIGMTETELDRANRRLSGREAYTVAPSRYLGHYVAGNLARQLGVAVRLQDDPAGGLVATVTLPAELLSAPGEEPAPTVPDRITAEWTDGGWADDDWPDDAMHDVAADEPAQHGRVDDEPATGPITEPVADEVVEEEPAVVTEGEPDREPDLEHILYGRLYGDGERAEEPLPVDPVDPLEHPAATFEEPVATSESTGALPRRVPGAQRPDAPAFRRPTEAAPTDDEQGDAVPAGAPTEANAAGAFGFLQAFQSSAPSSNGHDTDRTEEDR